MQAKLAEKLSPAPPWEKAQANFSQLGRRVVGKPCLRMTHASCKKSVAWRTRTVIVATNRSTLRILNSSPPSGTRMGNNINRPGPLAIPRPTRTPVEARERPPAPADQQGKLQNQKKNAAVPRLLKGFGPTLSINQGPRLCSVYTPQKRLRQNIPSCECTECYSEHNSPPAVSN